MNIYQRKKKALFCPLLELEESITYLQSIYANATTHIATGRTVHFI
jgi:hypothetical protein